MNTARMTNVIFSDSRSETIRNVDGTVEMPRCNPREGEIEPGDSHPGRLASLHEFPLWRSFLTLDSSCEATSASVCCNFSFATLEVACCHPGRTSFALTERKQADVWRWAICSPDGTVLHTGCEATQTGAKRVAEKTLQLEET